MPDELNSILADLLTASGRQEQKLDGLSQRLEEHFANHEVRLTRVEKLASKIVGAVTVVSVPATMLYNYITRKHTS